MKSDLAKLQLTSPVCTKEGEKIALSRRVEKHWRLIGWGQIQKVRPQWLSLMRELLIKEKFRFRFRGEMVRRLAGRASTVVPARGGETCPCRFTGGGAVSASQGLKLELPGKPDIPARS